MNFNFDNFWTDLYDSLLNELYDESRVEEKDILKEDSDKDFLESYNFNISSNGNNYHMDYIANIDGEEIKISNDGCSIDECLDGLTDKIIKNTLQENKEEKEDKVLDLDDTNINVEVLTAQYLKEKEEIQNAYSILSNQYDELIDKHNLLCEEFDELQSLYNELFEAYDDINIEHQQLRNKFKDFYHSVFEE